MASSSSAIQSDIESQREEVQPEVTIDIPSPSSPTFDVNTLKLYLPLYKAILEGNLTSVRRFCNSNEQALEASITLNLDTALHIAVGTGMANHIVDYLLTEMSNKSNDQAKSLLKSLKNKDGNTVLSIAAIVGNVEAAEKILGIQPELIEIENDAGWIPLIEAARHGQRKMITVLLEVSQKIFEHGESDSSDKADVLFVNFLIVAGIYDLTLQLVERYPSLATRNLHGDESILFAIARNPSAFPSVQYTDGSKVTANVKLAPETKLMHHKVRQLVKLLCKEITTNLDYGSAQSMLKPPLLLAAKLGVCEVVEEIITSFPDAIWFSDEDNHNILHLAVINRREKIFNLIFQMSGHKHLLLMSQDNDGNNILHLAGLLAPANQLNLIPGAALQMQRELQWFKEVEKIVQPAYKEDKNSRGKTPAMIFTHAHKQLVMDGEKWMKGAAKSCSIAAALIATVVFAAAITVPGGNATGGSPNFYKQRAFLIFAISDALALFSSVAAIIMFLSILTARYAEDDFLYVLPNSLIGGLITLFLSVTMMMIAFGATVYMVFCDKKAHWILGLVGAAVCLPVSLLVYSQFTLLMDLVNSKHRARIFQKQSRSVLY